MATRLTSDRSSNPRPLRLRFDRFELDEANARLFCDGEPVALDPRHSPCSAHWRNDGSGIANADRSPRRAMMPNRAALHPITARSRLLVDHARARLTTALARYLATPLDEFTTLTAVDRRALAAVLRRGDVLLTAGSTRCAELVKRVTRSAWSHVSMYVGPLEDRPDPLCIVEADFAAGVRAIRLSEIDARRISVLRPRNLADTDRARLAEHVLRHIGSEYDLAHAWRLARRLFVRRWCARPRSVTATLERGARGFVCSSLIAHAFAMIGHPLLPSEATVRDRDGCHNLLVPADFDRASLFAIVWRVDACDERI